MCFVGAGFSLRIPAITQANACACGSYDHRRPSWVAGPVRGRLTVQTGSKETEKTNG